MSVATIATTLSRESVGANVPLEHSRQWCRRRNAVNDLSQIMHDLTYIRETLVPHLGDAAVQSGCPSWPGLRAHRTKYLLVQFPESLVGHPSAVHLGAGDRTRRRRGCGHRDRRSGLFRTRGVSASQSNADRPITTRNAPPAAMREMA